MPVRSLAVFLEEALRRCEYGTGESTCCRNVFQCKWLPSKAEGGRSFSGDELEEYDVVSSEQNPEEESDAVEDEFESGRLSMVTTAFSSMLT